MGSHFKIFTTTLVLSFFLIVISCHKKPTVCFSVNDTYTEEGMIGYVNSEREFVVTCDRDANRYSWDFGDLTPIEEGNKIKHKFSAVGSYTITCTGFTKKDSTIVTQIFEVLP